METFIYVHRYYYLVLIIMLALTRTLILTTMPSKPQGSISKGSILLYKIENINRPVKSILSIKSVDRFSVKYATTLLREYQGVFFIKVPFFLYFFSIFFSK